MDMWRVGLALAGAAALVLLLIWAGQRRMIYFPSGHVPAPAQVGLPRAEPVTFPTADGLTLHGWFVPTTPAGDGTTVLVFNGNAGNRAYRADLAEGLAAVGLSVLLFDYRGYGGNPGSPSEAGLARDAAAARRYLETRADVRDDRVVYFGESLGAAVAVRLAVERPPLALVLRSPFTSLVDAGRYHFGFLPVSLLLRDRYPAVDRISQVRCPVVVITAAHDSIVPAPLSRRLFEAAAEPKELVVIERADHNDFALVAGPEVIRAVAGAVYTATASPGARRSR
ncbi:MAG TPA: alpha/beta hydrolase [Vicinamibacterales bacterium]|nr:alpha/beta hydrolase [Vicinamibacterales bacterium]